MKKTYMLNTNKADARRTLWNNLVVGRGCSTLEQEEDYMPHESALPEVNACTFAYGEGVALIRVFKPNTVEIEAEDEGKLRVAESSLMKICEGKGVPICEAS